MSSIQEMPTKQARPKPDFIDLFMLGAPMFAGIYFSGGPITTMTVAGFSFGIMAGWVGSKLYHSPKTTEGQAS